MSDIQNVVCETFGYLIPDRCTARCDNVQCSSGWIVNYRSLVHDAPSQTRRFTVLKFKVASRLAFCIYAIVQAAGTAINSAKCLPFK